MSAPATLTEFADLHCPFCADYARDVLPAVVDRYVRTGRLRLELQLLAFLGDDSLRGGRMAAAAARQDRLLHAGTWLASARRDAARLHVQGTPAFSLRVGGGRPIQVQPRELTPESFVSALDTALTAH
jgi:protein-disulfide isomerase